jgi:hypothetical protein
MDTLAVLRRRERMIAVVRWLGVVFAAVQFTIYQPPSPEFAEVAARARPVGYGFAVALAVVGVLAELAIRRVRDPRRFAQLGAVLLVADVAAVTGIVYLFTFDPISATWAIMAFMPLEGALRFQLPGAMAVWGSYVVTYPLRETLGMVLFDLPFEVSSVVYRLGLLLVITLFAGFMARDLDTQLTLLRRLNAASRDLAAQLEPSGVLETLCRQAHTCLDARSAVVYSSDEEVFEPVASWPRRNRRISAGLALSNSAKAFMW